MFMRQNYICLLSISEKDLKRILQGNLAQSAGAVEYTDCFSAEG